MTPTIAVLGIGRMGAALTRALLAAGYTTTIWNRTAEKCTPLVALGAKAAATVQEAAGAADVIIVNVTDYKGSLRLLQAEGVEQVLGGKLIVQLTSGSPDAARRMAAWAAGVGADYLDGAIMATPNFIGRPEGTVLYSGSRALFTQQHAVFLALGGNAQHVGEDVGHASALDLALLVQMWGALFGTLQALAICAAEDIPVSLFAQYLAAFKPVVDGATLDLVDRVERGALSSDEHTLASLGTHYSSFQQLLELCQERGLNRIIPDAFDRIFRAAANAGKLDNDFAMLSRFMSPSLMPA